MLQDTGMKQLKPVGSPINENTLAEEARSNLLKADEHAMYWRNLGSLMYIATQATPDQLVAISMLSSYLQEPSDSQRKAAKSVLRYLNGTKT